MALKSDLIKNKKLTKSLNKMDAAENIARAGAKTRASMQKRTTSSGYMPSSKGLM